MKQQYLLLLASLVRFLLVQGELFSDRDQRIINISNPADCVEPFEGGIGNGPNQLFGDQYSIFRPHQCSNRAARVSCGSGCCFNGESCCGDACVDESTWSCCP